MSASTPTDGKRRSGSRCSGRWVSAPTLISWGPGRLDGFALGLSDHRVHHKWGAQHRTDRSSGHRSGPHGTRPSATRSSHRSLPSPAGDPAGLTCSPAAAGRGRSGHRGRPGRRGSGTARRAPAEARRTATSRRGALAARRLGALGPWVAWPRFGEARPSDPLAKVGEARLVGVDRQRLDIHPGRVVLGTESGGALRLAACTVLLERIRRGQFGCSSDR